MVLQPDHASCPARCAGTEDSLEGAHGLLCAGASRVQRTLECGQASVRVSWAGQGEPGSQAGCPEVRPGRSLSRDLGREPVFSGDRARMRSDRRVKPERSVTLRKQEAWVSGSVAAEMQAGLRAGGPAPNVTSGQQQLPLPRSLGRPPHHPARERPRRLLHQPLLTYMFAAFQPVRSRSNCRVSKATQHHRHTWPLWKCGHMYMRFFF